MSCYIIAQAIICTKKCTKTSHTVPQLEVFDTQCHSNKGKTLQRNISQKSCVSVLWSHRSKTMRTVYFFSFSHGTRFCNYFSTKPWSKCTVRLIFIQTNDGAWSQIDHFTVKYHISCKSPLKLPKSLPWPFLFSSQFKTVTVKLLEWSMLDKQNISQTKPA